MDLSHPEYVILGENRARILHRLAVLSEPASGRRIHDLSGVHTLRSTQRILDELVALGLVQVQRIGPANAYRLNRGHLLWDPIEHILALRATTTSAIEQTIRRATGDAIATAAIYGSVARGEAGPQSDVDVLLLWKEHIPTDRRDAILDALDTELRQVTGNPAQVLAITHAELARLVAHNDPLIQSLRTDGRTVTGIELNHLLSDAPTTPANPDTTDQHHLRT